MGSTKEHAEKTREDLLKSGLKLFTEKGFASTRLEDVAKDAGVTRGAFYWHFQNKLELFVAIFSETIKIISRHFTDIINRGLSPLETIRTFMLDTANRFTNDEDYRSFSILFYSIEWTPEVRDAVETAMEKFEKEHELPLEKIIEQGKEQGEINDSIVTEVIIKAFEIYLAGMAKAVFDHKKHLTEEEIVSVIDIFIRGIKK